MHTSTRNKGTLRYGLSSTMLRNFVKIEKELYLLSSLLVRLAAALCEVTHSMLSKALQQDLAWPRAYKPSLVMYPWGFQCKAKARVHTQCCEYFVG